MKKVSSRSQFDRAGRADLASAEKKDFKKPSILGGFFIGVVLMGLTVSAAAQEASATPATAEDRARFLKMLKEISLPPVVSYNQAPTMSSSAVNYNQAPLPLALPGISGPLRQHDVEEAPRRN